jgi:hypothetical protein
MRPTRAYPEYPVWKEMRARCYNPRNKAFENYGARGITVCRRWRESFAAFLSDMGRRPPGRNGKMSKYTLERRKNFRGYTPNNCLWATWSKQMRNRRNNRMITFRGRTRNMQAWADDLDINKSSLRQRLHRWPSLARALTEPKDARFI